MKKQFFYAAFAIAMMASCTSENEPVVDQPTPDAEDKVAIELGIATDAMTIGSRGTGIVGGVLEEGETDGTIIAAAKKWDSQQLFVAMVKKTSGTDNGSEVTEGTNNTPIFQNLQFRAPKNDATDNSIRIYKEYTEADDEGTLQYKYYPIVGAYDFYGYHVDVENATTTTLNITPGTTPTATVKGITIDGSQDIMAAKTLPLDNINYPGLTNEMNPFSAKSARNNIKPILNFTHELARLKFYVVSGEGSNAALNYMDNSTPKDRLTNGYQISNDNANDNWTGTDADYTKWQNYLNGAIYVTDIKVKGMAQKIELDLIAQEAKKDATDNEESVFSLQSTPEQANVTDSKLLQTLVAAAPKYSWNHPDIANEPATPIGESIMFLPVTNGTTGTDKEVNIEVTLGQCLIDTENETTDPHSFTYYWDTPKPVTLTLKAKDIDGLDNTNAVFEPGKSYNVYITIYGRERIEISAELTPWVEGGDINTDIESGYEENNTQTTNP